ncbi:MAG: hypothetical protein ACJ75Q_14340 [Gaiellaceae bacterium]
MRTSEFDKLAREQLRTLLPDFAVATGLVFEVPIADLLRGLSFQGSSYDQTSFYLVAFIQPLYIPSDEVVPTFSERSPRFPGTDALGEIRSFVAGAGRTFFEHLRTPADFADWLEREERGHRPDPFALEALAYSRLLAGQAEVARRWLDLTAETAGAYIRRDIDEGLYAENEEHPLLTVRERTTQLCDALAVSAQDALAVLERWRQETASHLGLSQHLAPARTRASG